MESYDYQTSTVLDYLPNKIDLSEQLLLSSDIKERRYNEFIPINSQQVKGISSTSMSFVTQFKISSQSEWLDFQSCNLSYAVGNVVVPAGSSCNTVVMDGKYACINRITASINGQEIGVGNNDLNKHQNIKYLNESFTSNYLSDAVTSNGGNVKLQSVLTSSLPPVSDLFYESLNQSPYNMVVSTNTANLEDATGVLVPAGVAVQASYGYKSLAYPNKLTQGVTIPMSELLSVFAIDKYFPLFLVPEMLINIYWASPVSTFWSDCGVYSTILASYLSTPLTSYDISNIKITGDLLQCSEALNNSYRVKAMSNEGINLVFDDILVKSGGSTKYNGSQNVNMQVNLSTSSLKSVLFYIQSNKSTQQNAFSNSHCPYLGLSNFWINLNNKQYPQIALNSTYDIASYNLKNKGVNGNQLSNFVSSNPFVYQASEVTPTGATTDIVPSVTTFSIYSNFEKIINENPQIIKNGVDLKTGNCTINLNWNENNDVNASDMRTAILGDSSGQYTPYVQCCYQRLLQLKDGMVNILG